MMGLSQRKLASILVAVPTTASDQSSATTQTLDFTSIYTFPRPWESKQPQANNAPTNHLKNHCKGTLQVAIQWMYSLVDDATPVPSSLGSYSYNYQDGTSKDPISPHQVTELVAEGELDPNDPRDNRLLQLVRRGSALKKSSHAFRLKKVEREMVLPVNDESTKIHQLYDIRNRKPNYFRQNKVKEAGAEHALCSCEESYLRIPSSDAFLVGDIIDKNSGQVAVHGKELTKLLTEYNQDLGDDVMDEKFGNKNRKLNKFLKEVQDKAMSKKAKAKIVTRYEDFVKDNLPEGGDMLQLELCLAGCLSLFQPQHKLRPNRKMRKADPSYTGERNLIIQIKRGHNFPIRKPWGVQVPSQSRTNLHDPTITLKPFVELSFQGQTLRSEPKVGCNPSWNQTLSVKLSSPNGWSPKDLNDIMDALYINVFDEVKLDPSQDDRTEENALRTGKKWLGSFTLPFATMYHNNTVEGTFALNCPIIALDYEPGVKEQMHTNDSAHKMMLTFFVTVDPPLPPPVDTAAEDLDEDTPLEVFSRTWLRQCHVHHPPTQHRVVQCFGTSKDSERVFVTRFIKPQLPPPECDTYEKCQRFVSLIPFMQDSNLFDDMLHGKLDVWNTSQEFLDLGCGDWEEHSILLCNYFLALPNPIEAYVVLGYGIPEGETAYVLEKKGMNQVILYNASTGDNYDSADPYCPLESVGCVFNAENIFVNIQSVERPCEMVWDFRDPLMWKPFCSTGHGGFPGRDVPTSIQGDAPLGYPLTNPDFTRDCEMRLELAIQANIEKWRNERKPPLETLWNSGVGLKLRPLLVKMEDDKLGLTPLTRPLHDKDLESIHSTFEMSGFPLNMYGLPVNQQLEEEGILEAIRNTDIHNSEGTNLQFALKVYIKAYPCSVFSVWVYLAAIKDKRAGQRRDY